MEIRPQTVIKSFFFISFLTVPWQNLWASGQENSFNEVYHRVFSASYESLPTYKIERKHFGKTGDHSDNHVLQAGIRSLTFSGDFYDFPSGQKLFQANGICFSGQWAIDRSSGYTGLFAKGVRVPVIARASVALNGTLQMHKRAFGMAVKLFPTSDPDKAIKTQNLFVMHSLGGVNTRHVLDLVLDNEPSLGSLPPLRQLGNALRLRKDFALADSKVGSSEARVGFRPVSHLSKVTANGTLLNESFSPQWLRLRADDSMSRLDHDDFRDELRTERYPNSRIVWLIEAASAEDTQGKKRRAKWNGIGKLVLSESITSAVCDRQLYFQHPVINE